MCRSRAEGGQRCYSHALKSVQRATAAYDQATGWESQVEARNHLHNAMVDLASTPSGREQLASVQDGDLSVSTDVARGLLTLRSSGSAQEQATRFLDEGKLVAERNRALGDLTRKEKVERFGDRAKRIAQSFGPTAAMMAIGVHHASSNFSVGVTVGTAAGALGAALAGYARWKKSRVGTYMPEREVVMRKRTHDEVQQRMNQSRLAQATSLRFVG
jgi:hypothetical protein